MQRGGVQGRFSTLLDNFSTMHCDVTTPCGVRLWVNPGRFSNAWFQSTHSLRSATPAPLQYFRRNQFQSTHSLRSATVLVAQAADGIAGFNPRTPCGVRLISAGNDETPLMVSIHALLAECDQLRREIPHDRRSFNPRTPCGVRPGIPSSPGRPCKFQSTHSLRSATLKT